LKSLLLVFFCAFAPCAYGQYSVNWPTQPATPFATEVQPGTQSLRVSGVNDFLYTYDINLVEITTPTPTNFPSGGVAGCPATYSQIKALSDDATAAVAAYLKLFPDSPANPKSLLQTQNDWKANIKPAYDRLEGEATGAEAEANSITDAQTKKFCDTTVSNAERTYNRVLKPADARLNQGSHAAEATFQVKNCKSEILTVVEKYNGTPTGQSITVRLDAECDQFTVGGGVLLSEIQARTYTSVALPNQTGQFLSVSGTGKFHPTFIGLTSFNFSFEPLGHSWTRALGDARLGISVGPVVQGTKSDVSAFGWFAGPTVSFLRRLYISPGVHIGEFADYPAGFKNGQQIPANFGTPTPVKRWTTRFAIAITIKGWDVSKLITGGQDQPAAAPKK
jgi:hypothetical protein